APAAVAPAPPQAPGENDAAYSVRLKSLEQRVDELKEKIFRSKARLNLLKETVLHGVIAGSRAVIVHDNDMGSSFRLIKAIYAIDGAQIFAKSDETGALAERSGFEVFNGSIVPGNHTVNVLLVYQGHGYGIFSYLKDYKFTVRGTHTFMASEGKQTVLKVVGYEKGNITTDLGDRPAVDFRVTVIAAQGAVAGAKE
ncbi:MAG: dihydrolipoamide acetyltransferase, partial [Myxococcota bacterium]